MFSLAEEQLLVAAIRVAEKQTSGEVRLHLEAHCTAIDPYTRALEVFEKLEMHQTKLRNGVIIYMAIEDRKFAIAGDEGIHLKVGDAYWQSLSHEMSVFFRKGELVRGLVHGILGIGVQLSEHFPFERGDQNELSDEISFS